MSNESNFDPPREAGQSRPGEQGSVAGAPRPLVLAIDTATGARSLGVFRGTTPPGQLSLHVSEQRAADSSTVLGDVDRVLRAASVGVKEIELFALAVGPGSFTGLRAGLATVKALATTLRRRAVGVPTLHAVAHAAAARAGTVVAMIPAGRGEVFAQHLSLKEDGGVFSIFEHGPPTHVPPGELIESFRATRGRVTWAGEGAEKYRALIEEAARVEGVDVVEAPAFVEASAEEEGGRVWSVVPCAGALAGNVAALALPGYGAPENFAVENLRALYVRPADARIGGA